MKDFFKKWVLPIVIYIAVWFTSYKLDHISSTDFEFTLLGTLAAGVTFAFCAKTYWHGVLVYVLAAICNSFFIILANSCNWLYKFSPDIEIRRGQNLMFLGYISAYFIWAFAAYCVCYAFRKIITRLRKRNKTPTK